MTSAFFVIIFFVKYGESQTHFNSHVMSLGLIMISYGRVAIRDFGVKKSFVKEVKKGLFYFPPLDAHS